MPSYQILQLVDSQVEKFRSRKPVEGAAKLARKHYEPAGEVEAAGPYEAWTILRNGGVELPRPFGVGDVLETADEAPLVCNYWGIEVALWKDPMRFGKLDQPFSIVCYLSGDLARFVKDLRCELNPGCEVRSHLTILPPRELTIGQEQAVLEFQSTPIEDEPFTVEIGPVAVFEKTHVIKLDVGEGKQRVVALHDRLAAGSFLQDEVYEYDPHITLSMDADPNRTEELMELARKRWESFQGSKELKVETLTLVRQAEDESWNDLAEVSVGQPVAVLA